MGNGQGLTDLTGAVITEDDINDAAQRALAAFGQPSNIFLSPHVFGKLHGIAFFPNPEYEGTPWASKDRLTKREHAIAKVHTTLKKLGVLKRVSNEEFDEIKDKTVRRLKRAKWAKVPTKKVQSPG